MRPNLLKPLDLYVKLIYIHITERATTKVVKVKDMFKIITKKEYLRLKDKAEIRERIDYLQGSLTELEIESEERFRLQIDKEKEFVERITKMILTLQNESNSEEVKQVINDINQLAPKLYYNVERSE